MDNIKMPPLPEPEDVAPYCGQRIYAFTAKHMHEYARAAVQANVPDTQTPLLNWVVERWIAEVSNRPLVNVHRRTLDDTWRQVIRFAGGDPDELLGPSHDAMLSAIQKG